MKKHQHWYRGKNRKIQSKLFLNIINIPWLDKIRVSDSKSNYLLGLIWPLSCHTQEAEGDQPVSSVGATSWPGWTSTHVGTLTSFLSEAS
jgi:hypothetical protein